MGHEVVHFVAHRSGRALAGMRFARRSSDPAFQKKAGFVFRESV